MSVEVGAKARHVELQLLGVPLEIGPLERLALGKEKVVVLPELSLRVRCERGLCGEACVSVPSQRSVLEYNAQVVAEALCKQR
jgi:hypothetical protein